MDLVLLFKVTPGLVRVKPYTKCTRKPHTKCTRKPGKNTRSSANSGIIYNVPNVRQQRIKDPFSFDQLGLGIH